MTENETAKICKALGDENRLKIIGMLKGGELCACHLLDAFNITQPTLSHHMKILSDCDLVTSRKDGKWTYYGINRETFMALQDFLGTLSSTAPASSSNCSCGKSSV